MNIKNRLVTLLVWIALLVAIGSGVQEFLNGKTFNKFSENIMKNEKIYELKKKLIYIKNSNLEAKIFDYKDLKKYQDEDSAIKNGIDDAEKREKTDEIKDFINSLNSVKSYKELDAFYKIIEQEGKDLELKDEVELEAYNSYLQSKTVIIAVILGFLSIFFVIKIEWDRLGSERKHYREQAKDNVSDILNFSANLMEEIDRKHIDFMYTLKEIEQICNVFKLGELIDLQTLEIKQEYEYLKKTFIVDTVEIEKNLKWYQKIKHKLRFTEFTSKELGKHIKFSIAFVRNLISDEKLQNELGCSQNIDGLKQLYYTTLSRNFDEYLSSVDENSKDENSKKAHSINEEVKKIPGHIEEIILKKDFEIDDYFAKKYIDIVDSIKNFENILEGRTGINDLVKMTSNQK